MEIIIALVALCIGFLVGYLLASLNSSRLKNEVLALHKQIEFQKQHFEKAADDKETSFQLAMNTQKQFMKESADSMQARFDETIAKLKAEVTALTAELLKKHQSEFEASSRESVSRIIEPLTENIADMRRAVADNTKFNSELSGRLDSNLKMVLSHSDAARKSADRLADALRGGGKIQGDWGETVLTELLQAQGLVEGIHFDVQASLKNASGLSVKSDSDRLMRPDVVLHLDKYRDVIIDAKVSLSAYLDYINADSDEARAKALKNHVQSVENHVNELARKDYSSFIAPPKKCMDYVIMFVPNTAALYAATSAKPHLWRKAMEKNVYIADEQTLYAALRIINMTWRQIAQAENHERVFALANEMLDRVSVFYERFAKIGKQLDDARKSYDDALAKLRDSGQSIPQTCRKLINLGASVKQRKGVDPSLFAVSQDDSAPEASSLTQDTNQGLP